jgi:signal recognition particle receptor subunit beta
LKEVKLLIFANKQDLKDALTSSEVAKELNLHKIKSHDWHIQVHFICNKYRVVVHYLGKG